MFNLYGLCKREEDKAGSKGDSDERDALAPRSDPANRLKVM